jgi:hypothetical protein
VRDDQPPEIPTLPQSSVGAPYPLLVAAEHSLTLAYYLEERPQERGIDQLCVVLPFNSPYAHMFGPPNDEAFSGHLLDVQGLATY